MVRKLTALAVLICMLSGISLNFGCYAEAEAETKTAGIQFSKYFKSENISRYRFDPADHTTRLVRDGRECIRFSYTPRTTYIYLDVDDEAFWHPEGIDVRVTVDYFDEGKGTFTLRYGSLDEKYCDYSDVVKLEDTCEWKSHEFILQNAVFTNKTDGYDIVLGEWSTYMARSPEEVIFGGIKIEELQKTIKTSITSEITGNIFSMEDEKALTVNVENYMSESMEAEFAYSIFDEKDKCVYEDCVTQTIAAEGKSFEIKPELNKYGTYTLKGTISCRNKTGETFTEEVEEWLSVVNKFKEGEERNANFGMSTHFNRYRDEEKLQTSSRILSEMGIGFARSEECWHEVETTKGKFKVTDYWTAPQVLKEKGVDTLMILDYGNALYGKDDFDLPATEENLKGFAEYCKFIATTYKGIINCYEIWNEPNNGNFNSQGRTAADYANLLKYVYPVLKEVDPNITVVGCATVEVPHDWLKQVFDAGGYDYLDAVSIHPYDWSAGFQKQLMRNDVQAVHELMSQYGEEKELWYTEVGWSIGTEPTWGISAEVRPIYGVQMYIMSMAEKLADKIFWYDFQNDGNNPGPSTYNLGTIKNFEGLVTPWAANRIYVAYAALNKFLGNAVPEEIIKHDDGTVLYKFRRPDGKNVIAVWSETDNQTVSVNLGASEAEKYDIYSNKLATIKSDNGIFLLSAEKSPVYYVGDFSSFEEKPGNISIDTSAFTLAMGDNFIFKAADSSGRDVSLEINTDLKVKENERGEAVLSIPDSSTGSYTAEFNVYAGGMLCYSGVHTITAVEPLKTSVSVKQINSSRYSAVLRIHNNSNEKSISGKAELKVSGDSSYSPNSVRFIDIPPEAGQSFEIRLPKMLKATLTELETNIICDNGYTYSTSGKYDFTFAQYCREKPVIDGVIEENEWKGGWIAAESVYDARYIPKWEGKDDLSFSANLMWDEENLYIAAAVRDNVFYQPYTDRVVWQADSMQIGINNLDEPDMDTQSFTSILMALEGGGPKISRYSSFYRSETGVIEAADCKIKRTKDSTVYEAVIPWSEIFYDGYIPSENKKIGFSALVNDSDGFERRGWIEYTSGIGSGKNSKLFGTMNLIK